MNARRFGSLGAALGVVALVACAQELSQEGSRCPCTNGYVCCDGIDPADGFGHSSCKLPGACDAYHALEVDAGADAVPTFDGATCFAQRGTEIYWVDSAGTVHAMDTKDHVPFSWTWSSGSQPTTACGIVADESSVYSTVYGKGTVLRLSVDFAKKELGAKNATVGAFLTPSSLAVDDHSIYVTESDTGQVKRVAKTVSDASDAGDAGASETVFVAQGGVHPRALLVAGERLAWLDDGGLRKMAKTGGPIETVAGQSTSSLVLSGNHLFWIAEERVTFDDGREKSDFDQKRLKWTAIDDGAAGTAAPVSNVPPPPDPAANQASNTASVSSSYYDGVYSLTAFDGQLFFGGTYGIDRIDPGAVVQSEKPPSTRIFDYNPHERRPSNNNTIDNFLLVNTSELIFLRYGTYRVKPRN